MNKYLKLIIGCILTICCTACEKFLEEKSDVALSVPDNLDDLDALMNFYTQFVDDPQTGEISSADFYLSDVNLASLLSSDARNAYLWTDDVFLEDNANDWNTIYSSIYYSNLVLEKLAKLEKEGTVTDRSRFNRIKGEALFNRGRKYLGGVWIWGKVYNESSAAIDLGMPLRLTSNFNEKIERANIRDTYQQIIHDLKTSTLLLPDVADHLVKPSRAAALAMLSRTYLSMGKYQEAVIYADSALQLKHDLLDFNTLDRSKKLPIDPYNAEVLLSTALRSSQILGQSRLRVTEELVNLFADNDLRKPMFFTLNADQSYSFRAYFGNTGGTSPFSGPAVNEMYLNRAEGNCRIGNLDLAIADMNRLLAARFKPADFTPWPITLSKEELLQKILLERRKELLYRGIRWIDIKRLNSTGADIDLVRNVNGKKYELKANELRWILQLPRTVIELGGYTPNPR